MMSYDGDYDMEYAPETIAQITSSDQLQRVLYFIRDNEGIVLADWAARPQTLKECRAVFPTKIRKLSMDAGSSEFTKRCINHFYPNIEESKTGNHRVTVLAGGSRKVQLLESDLERRRIHIPDANKLEYPTYAKALRESSRWKFLGMDGILVQRTSS